MEALVISAGEPQLERCLEATRNQTIPFSNVVHVSDVVPQHVAFNTGIKKIVDEWVMKVDGDMVLYDNAVETVSDCISNNGDASIYIFAVYDDFMTGQMIGCKVYKTEMVKSIEHPDRLKNDLWIEKKIRHKGGKVSKYRRVIIATHAENPDEFQIFRRFYVYGVKYGKGCGAWSNISKQFCNTGDERYAFAMKSLEFGMEKREYPGSHNIEFDKKMYDEFKNGYR